MLFTTRHKIRGSVLNELTLVSGSNVQTYLEPMINDFIQNAFDHLFSKRFWPHLTSTTFHSLDGTDGVITDVLAGIESYADIQWVREEPFDTCDGVPYFDSDRVDNTELSYTHIPYGEDYYEDKRIRFTPKESSVNVAIRARRRPRDFEEEDMIPFDRVALMHFVVANTLAIDGMNIGAQLRHQALFDDRYSVIVSNEADRPIISESERFRGEFTVADEVVR